MAQEKWLIQPGETKVLDIELVRALKVGLIGGQVDIIGHDEQSARIEVHSVSGKDLKISIDGDTLEIDHPQLRWDNFIEVFRGWRDNAKADVSVLVPRDVALKFGVVSASALVSGLAGDSRLSTVSGEVVVDELSGSLELNSVSGELSVRNHTGRINAHTVSGDITATGDITRFSVDGVSADVFLDLNDTPDEITANSVSGDLTLRLANAGGCRYVLNTITGKLLVDNTRIVGARGKAYTGTLGSLDGSWSDIRVNSVSGNVSMLRSAAAPGASAGTGSEAGATA
ncbi:DUF4097 family beta strand repeat-containing protein [Leifsonia sp. Root112D2]|jgi:DUF4097 and DUF4098 domain-containing protein YvlB|uniref:DUF4097 family beta strand repeat-containing protein n=1 Tax=Leifsonia sp. Root112D2 TaxID=1736426 RepID=UPI0006F25728|nr:DUF4097 family beta strand repeat-containing protein [Leifsonia sp. Root112D2]KQV06937.1 hypothetical protein ASC63_06165 [Leifsonia sp. Root112D2]